MEVSLIVRKVSASCTLRSKRKETGRVSHRNPCHFHPLPLPHHRRSQSHSKSNVIGSKCSWFVSGLILLFVRRLMVSAVIDLRQRLNQGIFGRRLVWSALKHLYCVRFSTSKKILRSRRGRGLERQVWSDLVGNQIWSSHAL